MFFSGCEIIENLNKKNIFIICKKTWGFFGLNHWELYF